jgi:predicted metal-dependent HD superfamily phosphohydrolase
MNANPLQVRFEQAFTTLGVEAAPEDFAALDSRYQEPHRAYHNWRHISECLGELDDQTGNGVMEIAIFYHDAIYNTKGKENEEQSAKMCADVLSKKGVSQAVIYQAQDLILATRHVNIPRNEQEAAIIDIDLSILGRDPQRFQEYERNIRQEYGWAPIDAYRSGRKNILESFLGRAEQGSLYTLKKFRTKFERQAVSNLYWAIENLPQVN